jgi:S1-C subfamily serine protease
MTIRFVVGLFVLLCAYATANAQMSPDEAMQRMRDRQASRGAESSPSPTTKPAQLAGDIRTIDVSTQIQGLDVEIMRRFSGAIGAMWTSAQTQEWLNKAANSAAAAPSRLVNLQANAKIIVTAISPSRFEISGHLFPVNQRLALTNADKLDMKPAQTQADAAAATLAKLQFQCESVSSTREILAKELAVLQANHANSATVQINQDQTALSNFDNQLSTLQPQVDAARRASNEAGVKLRALEDQHLEADKTRLQAWGPIILRTSDATLLSKRPGDIFTAHVKVTAVAVRVIRIPDFAGWDFTSQEEGAGQTHMPTAGDDHGPGAIPPDVATIVWTACDDMGSAPPATAPVTFVPPVEPAISVTPSHSHQDPEPSGTQWSGSGFFITPDGLVLTNRHVAQGARTLVVVHGGQQSTAQVVALDDAFDLAVIRIRSNGAVPFVALSPLDVPNEGADCTVLGFPITDLVGNDLKITRGIVSSNSADMGGGADVMTDAKVNEGNSGGPIFDKYGNVIAVVRLKTVAKSFQESYGFGISAGHVRLFLKRNHISVPDGANGSALSTEQIVTKAKPATVFILGSN